MEKRRLIYLFLALSVAACFLAGCSAKDTAKEDADTITVYMWSTAMYEKYAPYVQSKLPDINIQFVVGNNDLEFYKFMNENDALPDIITCRRFSLHDAMALKGSLMDLSTTEEAGAIYDSYLKNFANEDGSVNWLPLCAEVDGLVANKALFDQYNIPLPTDYASFVSACQAFEEVGIRGFTADFVYDYTCMEILQGLIIPELTSTEGRKWRTRYEDPTDMEVTGLDDTIWPEAFARMEQFIKDVNLQPEDVDMDYSPVIEMFSAGKVAMIRSGGSNTVRFNHAGVNAIMLPYFGQKGEQWLLTYPQFQVALNRDLEQDKTRLEKAIRVLNAMLSEGAQNELAGGEDVLTYSQNVNLQISPYLSNLQPLINQNYLYIRIASNEFFSASRDVVSRMIRGEYNARQAFEAFDARLRQSGDASSDIVLTLEKGYSNIFHKDGGNEAYSVMAHTMREMYGCDVILAFGDSYTGSVFQADYSKKMVGNMVMPNALVSFSREMSGAELKESVRVMVEGTEGGFTPFNRGSLPVFSGITVEVKEENGAYTLLKLTKDGKPINDEDIFKVTFITTFAHMTPFFTDESREYVRGKMNVRPAWTTYILEGGTLAEPEHYITLK